MTHVTPAPWLLKMQRPRYGTADTYELAAEWLGPCATVADWGGGTGYFHRCLPSSVRYTLVDGTQHAAGHVVANLETYREPSDGILLRHVLEHVSDWERVLTHAMTACRHRLMVITFTPASDETRLMRVKRGWPTRQFRMQDIRDVLGSWLVQDVAVDTSHPEWVFYAERPA